MTKRKLFYLAPCALLLASTITAQTGSTFTGEINDRACARANSHDAMMKRHGSQNTKQCILDCIKAGGKYVLVDDKTQAVYLLDDQQKPAQFAGEKVTITGTLDKDSSTLHVADIQAAQ